MKGNPCVQSFSLQIGLAPCDGQRAGGVFYGGLVQYFCRQRFYGNNFEARAAYLWDLIQTFYRRVKDRLNQLTSNIVKNGLSTLSAAELRALIPFGLELTTRMCCELHSDLRTLHAVHAAMGHLKHAYGCLHVDVERVRGPQKVLFHQAVAFHSLLVTLNEGHPDLWELRPKHHMFLELAYEDSMPARTWTYGKSPMEVAWHTKPTGGLALPPHWRVQGRPWRCFALGSRSQECASEWSRP